MAYVFHEEAAPHLEQSFVHSLGIMAGESTGGILEIDRSGSMLGTGEKMQIPVIDEIETPQRRDISTTSQTRTYTEMGNAEEIGVILHDDIANSVPDGQKAFSGLDFQKFWLSRVGMQFARRAKQNLYRVAKTAIEAVDTPTTDCHISDVYSPTVNNTMTFSRLQDCRALLGDASGLLVTAVMHSVCWNNLVKDGISNYKVENVAGRLIQTGGITDRRQQQAIRKNVTQRLAYLEALGMFIIIDDDLTPDVHTSTTYVYGSRYTTLLFGPGNLLLSYQRGLENAIFVDRDMTDARGVTILMRAELDYCCHLFGVEWSSATNNPTDAQVGTKSNWSSCYSDHREVLCAKLLTNG